MADVTRAEIEAAVRETRRAHDERGPHVLDTQFGSDAGRVRPHDLETLLRLAESVLAALDSPAPEAEIDTWDASDPDGEWSDAHAYHAGFKAGYREGERYTRRRLVKDEEVAG